MTLATSPVLLYHEIDQPGSAKMPQWNVSPGAFRRQVEELLVQGFELVTVTELVNRVSSGSQEGKLAALTFDDGFKSFLAGALDVLVDLAATATVYVPTRWCDGAPGWMPKARGPAIMSIDEVADLSATGIEIGGHGRTHLHLDLLTSVQVRAEVEQNKLELEASVGHSVTSFAYPHGSHNTRARQIVRECGYENACAVNSAPIALGGDMFRVGRIVAREDTDVMSIQRGQQRLQNRFPDGHPSVATSVLRRAYRVKRRLRLHRHHQGLVGGPR